MKHKIPDIHLKNAIFLEDQVSLTGDKLFLFSTLLMPVAPAKCGCECEIDRQLKWSTFKVRAVNANSAEVFSFFMSDLDFIIQIPVYRLNVYGFVRFFFSSIGLIELI